MKRINEREVVNEGHEKFISGLDRYVKTQGIDSRLVNIPTIVTGLNDDGSIMQQEIEPYAYEVIDKYKKIKD